MADLLGALTDFSEDPGSLLQLLEIQYPPLVSMNTSCTGYICMQAKYTLSKKKKFNLELGMVVHTYNPGTRTTGARSLRPA